MSVTTSLSKAKAIKTKSEISWLITDMLPTGHRGMVANAEGGCKTTLLCWIALRVALGLDVFGKDVRQGPVLMIDEETPSQSLNMKLHRFCLGAGLEGRHEISHLVVKSFSGFRFARANAEILELIKELKPVLITIDTLLACLPSGRQGLEENNAKTGIAIRDDLNRMLDASPDCAILIAAHSAKPVKDFEIEDYRKAQMQGLVRGHGSIVGQACDTGYGLMKISEPPEPLRFAILPKPRREATLMDEVFVEMKEQKYGKGWARLEQIPPIPAPPSRAAVDFFTLFLDKADKEIKASQFRAEVSALYVPSEIRFGLGQLLRKKVIVTTRDNFTFKLNPKIDDEADTTYIDQLLAG